MSLAVFALVVLTVDVTDTLEALARETTAMKDKPIELWEAMDLCGISKSDLGLGNGQVGKPKKLSPQEVKSIRNKYWLLGSTQEDLATEFKVSHATIGSVVRREGAYDDEIVV